MRKTFATRITALSAALAVIAGAAASCGKKEKSSEQSKTPQQLMAASYSAVMLDTGLDLDSVTDMKKLSDGKLFIGAFSYNSAPTFYIADEELSDFNEIELDLGIDSDDENIESHVELKLTADEKVMAFATITDYSNAQRPDFDDPDFDFESFDFEEMRRNTKMEYRLYNIDLEGNILDEKEVKGLEKFESDDDDFRLSVNNVCPIEDGKAIVSMYAGDMIFAELDADGTIGDEIKFGNTEWVNDISYLNDGTIAVIGYSKGFYGATFYDSKTMNETGDELNFDEISGNTSVNRVFDGSGDYKLYADASSGLFGITEDNKATEIVNWLDSDMGNGSVSAFVPLDDGDFIVWYDNYDDMDESGLYRLTKRDPSELENTKIVTIGVLYDDWEVKQKVSSYNKAHDDVRFKIEDYSKYNEYDEDTGLYVTSAEGQLKKDIVSGKAPDMIVSYTRGFVKSLSNKGLFIDLYDMLDKDPDLSRDDIMPNVLKGSEIGGKLLTITPSFVIQTLAAKGANCDKVNWTVDEFIEVYNNLPEGMSMTPLDCKEYMFNMVMGCITDAVDYEKGTCSFDTPEIRKILELCDQLPSQDELIDWESDDWMNIFGDNNIKDNKILVEDVYLAGFDDYINSYRTKYEEDMVFLGYPSQDGQGSFIAFDQNFAILSNSDNKDECWDLIKEFFKEADENDGNEYEAFGWGFSSLKKNFDKQAEASMSKPFYIDDNGKKVEYDRTSYVGDKTVTIDSLTEAEKNNIVDFIMSVTKVAEDMDPEVEMIISEELMGFLKGEKTADEAIGLVQNRVSLLVSEQS